MGLKYLGCSTVSQQLYHVLKEKGVDVQLNSKKNDFDIIHAHTFGPLALSQQGKATSIISAHSTPSINKGNIILGGWKFWNTVYKKIYNKFDYVFAVSQTSVKELEEIGITKPIHILENGVNRGKFRYDEHRGMKFREEYGFTEDDYVVLNVAQITPRKGVYDFIEVAKRNQHIKFIWIGGFPYLVASSDYFKLKRMIKNVPSNLTFAGFVKDIVGAYSGADILFTPTYRETFGLTIIEADACKLPVLARDLEVFKELFDDEILYGNNVEQFCQVLQKKPKKGRGILSEKYDINKVADKLLTLYTDIT